MSFVKQKEPIRLKLPAGRLHISFRFWIQMNVHWGPLQWKWVHKRSCCSCSPSGSMNHMMTSHCCVKMTSVSDSPQLHPQPIMSPDEKPLHPPAGETPNLLMESLRHSIQNHLVKRSKTSWLTPPDNRRTSHRKEIKKKITFALVLFPAWPFCFLCHLWSYEYGAL